MYLMLVEMMCLLKKNLKQQEAATVYVPPW